MVFNITPLVLFYERSCGRRIYIQVEYGLISCICFYIKYSLSARPLRNFLFLVWKERIQDRLPSLVEKDGLAETERVL